MRLEEIMTLGTVRIIRNEEFLTSALGILAKAKRSVILCTYKFEVSQSPDSRNLNDLIKTLFHLVGLGINIRVLLNIARTRSGLTRINKIAARALQEHNIEVRTLPDYRCQHAKMLIVDGWLGIVGSHNWSPRSMTDNFEVSVELSGPEYFQEILKHFEMIWERSRGV